MKQIIVLLLILISVPSFGQYEKLFSDKNIAPYNLALKDKFIWKDSLVHRDSLTYAEITTDSIRFRYFDGSYTDWLKFDLNYFTNADETDPVYATDSANIVWFDDLDYFTNADETDPIFDAHLASSITAADTTWWGSQPDLNYFTNADETDPTVSDLVKGITAADTTWWGTQNNIWTENGDDIYYNDGNVGINTSTPSQKLDVAGKIALGGTVIAYRPTAFAGTLVLGDGGTNLSNTTGAEGYYNTFVGIGAGQANTTGSYNTANGYYSFYSNTTGSDNTANGLYSLYSNTTGYQNTANGYGSLFSNTTGYQNTTNGMYSLYSNTTGSRNTTNGMYSFYSNTTGYQNTANGYGSLYVNTTGYQNTANGVYSGRSIIDGSNNTFLGYEAGYNASQKTDASNSMALGRGAYTTADNQVVIGNTSVTDVLTSGKLQLSQYGNSAITGTVATYAAFDSQGNLIESSGTGSSGGDDWGAQVAQTDATLSGDGTSVYPLSVVSSNAIYPDAGIALSTGTAWGTSIINNSGNWNDAFGWGNHSGLYIPISHTVNNIINGAGFLKNNGTGTWSWDNSTYLTSDTETDPIYAGDSASLKTHVRNDLDLSITNEIQDINTTGAAGNISISSGSTLNLNVNDADASITNEIQDLSGSGATLSGYVISLSSDATPVTLPNASEIAVGDLVEVAASIPAENDVIKFNGTSWIVGSQTGGDAASSGYINQLDIVGDGLGALYDIYQDSILRAKTIQSLTNDISVSNGSTSLDFTFNPANVLLTEFNNSGFSITESQIYDLDHFTNADETDQIYAGDSANIVWFDDLDYFTNADETDPIFDAHLASNITTSDTTKWGAGYTHSLLTSGNPHSVTATNVGLGNVENAAASGLYEPIFSKNTGFNKNFGSTTGTVAQGNDSRINNGQTAYNDKINSLSFSGTTTKTLTLTQQDGSTLTDSFTDLQGVTGTGTSGQVSYWNGTSSQTGNAGFTYNGTNVTSTGTFNGTNFILNSDRRLKKNISQPYDLGWVDKIDFKQFRMKADDEFLRFGVIAQELEKINPELVRKDDKGIYSVAYIDLIIATLQSQREKIINIEKTISNLIKRIEKLEDEK